MQRRARDGDPAKLHGFEDSYRRERAGAANLHDDVVYFRRRLSGGVLVGDGPARRFAGRAKLILQSGRIHFHYQAVDLVTQVVALCFHRVAEIDHLIDRLAEFAIRVDAKAGALHPIEGLPMRAERFSVPCEQVIREHVEPAFCDHSWIKLTNRACRGIPGIRKPRLAFFFAFGIDSFKNLSRQIRFAADFNLRPNFRCGSS